MRQPKILVTGATGHTGGAIVAQLLKKDVPVRALVRSKDARSERLERLGAETVVADLYDPNQLADAFRGVSRAYYLPVFDPFMIQSAVAFSLAAREARLESIVQMSQWLAHPAHPSLATRQTWLVDRLFAEIPDIAHTVVNPGFFADNFLRIIDFGTLLGIYPVLTGASRSAPVSDEDIARVVTVALMDPDRHAGKSYRPTGPRLLSGADMAAAIQSVIGRRVRSVDLPVWMFLKVARQQGINPFLLSGYRYYLEDHRRGSFAFEGGVNDVVRELTGAPAEDFETTVRRYASRDFARPTLANRARALANFLVAPLVPGYDLDRYDRTHGFPAAPDPRFSIDDAEWRQVHSLQTPVVTRTPTSLERVAA